VRLSCDVSALVGMCLCVCAFVSRLVCVCVCVQLCFCACMSMLVCEKTVKLSFGGTVSAGIQEGLQPGASRMEGRGSHLGDEL